eukprot:TRINITY_DN4351_c0_g1_i8.p1 TRINITY_DN4351_c0_g1~~TRINITY_DN4351_c0_g1_i8.p1  ORF type:complete len:141 (+),score=36.36 TRINITY_DN4351_c0_g1_i8:122-544(+)
MDKFAADVRLVWRNAMVYNRPDSDIYQTAEKLSKLFERKFAKLKKTKKKSKTGGETREATRQDRVKFSQLINQLSGDQLGELVELIQKECPEALTEVDEEELEIEINAIDSATLFQLNEFAQGCINGTGPANKKRKRPNQ